MTIFILIILKIRLTTFHATELINCIHIRGDTV